MDGYIADLIVQEKCPTLEIECTVVNTNPFMSFTIQIIATCVNSQRKPETMHDNLDLNTTSRTPKALNKISFCRRGLLKHQQNIKPKQQTQVITIFGKDSYFVIHKRSISLPT